MGRSDLFGEEAACLGVAMIVIGNVVAHDGPPLVSICRRGQACGSRPRNRRRVGDLEPPEAPACFDSSSIATSKRSGEEVQRGETLLSIDNSPMIESSAWNLAIEHDRTQWGEILSTGVNEPVASSARRVLASRRAADRSS